jgi:hypothetical protein
MLIKAKDYVSQENQICIRIAEALIYKKIISFEFSSQLNRHLFIIVGDVHIDCTIF